VATNYWVYLVWVLISTCVFLLVPSSFPVFTATDWSGLLLAVVVGWTSLWYLYALALYFVLARCAVELPVWLPFTAAALAALAADVSSIPGRGDTDGVLGNLLFFFIGALTPQVVDRLVARCTTRLAVIWAVGYAGAFAVAASAGADRAVGIDTGLGLLGASLGVLGIVRAAAAAPSISRRLSWLGRQTLPIYVLHMPLLALLDVVMDRLPLDGRSTGLLPFVALYPLVATVVITGLCLLLHRLLLRCRATALFSLPAVRAAPARARPAAMRSRPLGSPSRRARVH
jgi:uncharacterized membrane protein YcfT